MFKSFRNLWLGAIFCLLVYVYVEATVYPTGLPTGQPSTQPSSQPSIQPSSQPSGQPSGQPSDQPTGQPSSRPSLSHFPTGQPSNQPTGQPSGQPSARPTSPTGQPSSNPTSPTGQPTGQPSIQPSDQPTSQPTSRPSISQVPTVIPTEIPTGRPTSSRPTTSFRPTTLQPTGYFSRDKVSWGYVTIDRQERDHCKPVQMEIGIAFNVPLYRRQAIAIETPGFTSGPCNMNQDGPDINPLVVYNSSLFTAKFFDSSTKSLQLFNYSYIRLVAQTNLDANTKYIIRIDRINGIKISCLSGINWRVKLKKTDALGAYFTYSTTNQSNAAPGYWSPLYNYESVGTINFTSFKPTTCFSYNSSLTVFPPHQLFPLTINFSLTLAFHLYSGDNITLYLPGFTTSGDFSRGGGGKATYNSSLGSSKWVTVLTSSSILPVVTSTNHSFDAYWVEGVDKLRYSDSSLVIYPKSFIPAATPFFMLIPQTSGLSSVCGARRNSSSFRFFIESRQSSHLTVLNSTIRTTQPIGPGCVNDCSGRGICDHCTSTCVCQDGYGSPADLKLTKPSDFPPDCSGSTCPLGVSFASPVPSPLPNSTVANKEANITLSLHRYTECSSSGLCDRTTGICKCFDGFTGRACERRGCLGSPPCNGRGLCYSMANLPSIVTADPLRISTVKDIDFYKINADGTAWDAEKLFSCVCDKGWDAGLGANQTNINEFFGPNCEFRRCPSGDDPTTAGIDETDCTNKTAPGSGIGRPGNKCYVECSHRGMCNYKTGVCTCFRGYHGVNCGILTK